MKPEAQINHVALDRIGSNVRDWWNVSLHEIELLATAVQGPRKGGWIRRGGERAIIRKTKYGAQATKLQEELAALNSDVKQMLRVGVPDAGMTAAALYHIRFENIHPLHNGNGRVGRLLLSGQCYQSYGFPPSEMLRMLYEKREIYNGIMFNPGAEETKFCRIAELLGTIVGVPLTSRPLNVHNRLYALFPSPGSP